MTLHELRRDLISALPGYLWTVHKPTKFERHISASGYLLGERDASRRGTHNGRKVLSWASVTLIMGGLVFKVGFHGLPPYGDERARLEVEGESLASIADTAAFRLEVRAKNSMKLAGQIRGAMAPKTGGGR